MDKQCGGNAQENEEILFGLEERSMMISFNNIICVLEGGDAVNKVMKIFLQWTPYKFQTIHGLPL